VSLEIGQREIVDDFQLFVVVPVEVVRIRQSDKNTPDFVLAEHHLRIPGKKKTTISEEPRARAYMACRYGCSWAKFANDRATCSLMS
jgi:hypothetical protein